MTVTRIGEQAGGVDNPAAEACLANYERYSGDDISREPPESGEFSSILRTCDLFTILLAGLTGAADDLTPEGLVASLETAGEIELVGSATARSVPTTTPSSTSTAPSGGTRGVRAGGPRPTSSPWQPMMASRCPVISSIR